MDKLLRIAALVAVTAAFAAPASAAPPVPVAAADPATATAQIVEPLTLTKSSDLSFGTLIKNSMTVANTVSISEAGLVTCAAELLCGGVTTAAAFDVEGSPDQTVKVYVATSLLTAPGGATLTFTPTAASASPLMLDTNGDASFAVGGSITVLPATPTGIYVGDMDVTVDYN